MLGDTQTFVTQKWTANKQDTLKAWNLDAVLGFSCHANHFASVTGECVIYKFHHLYSYYFTGLFCSLLPTYGLSFRPRALKFSAKFAVVIRKNRKKKFFGSDPRG